MKQERNLLQLHRSGERRKEEGREEEKKKEQKVKEEKKIIIPVVKTRAPSLLW